MNIKIKLIALILFISINLFAQHQYETNSISAQLTGIHDVNFINSNTGFAIGYNQGARIVKTTNKGLNWNLLYDFGNIQNNSGSAPSAISFLNDNTGWAFISYFSNQDLLTTYYDILKTTNGGYNWESKMHTTEAIGGIIKFTDDNIGYLLDNFSKRFMKTSNSGATWYEIVGPPNVESTFLSFGISSANPSNVYLVGSRFLNGLRHPVFYVSSNGGASFSYIYSGSAVEGFSGINDVSVVYYNNEDLVRIASGTKLYKFNHSTQNPFTQIAETPWEFSKLSFSGFNLGYAIPLNNPNNIIYRTDNHGLTWTQEEVPVYQSLTRSMISQFGNIFYIGGIPMVIRKLGMNLSVLFDNINSSGSFSFDGVNKEIPSSPTMHYLRGGNSILNAASILSENQTDEKIFYCWNSGSMNNYVGNYYFDNVGEIKASYKTKLKADNQWAINNANQTKAIRDTTHLNNNPLNLIHQVHESVGGIFYTRSTNGGTNWSREEVVNYNQFLTDAFGNRNPSITVKRRDLKPLTIGDQEKNVAAVWERFNQATGKTEIIASDRGRNIQNTDYEWKRYDNNTSTSLFTSFPSTADFQSTPKIFVYSPLLDQNLYQSVLVVPHLEKNGNNTKVVVSIRYKTNSYDLFVDEGDIKNLAVTAPFNYYGIFGLHMVYQKDNSVNNIVYKKIDNDFVMTKRMLMIK